MGKLYYITGNDQQIREKVYSAILQWTQDQQATPLQPWPAIPAEATQSPNFYLYNYLCHGTKQDLAQTEQTYGKDTIEPIYLQSNAEGETEEALLESGIYKSYDPQTDFQSCMQEMVETVFTGYQKISYDFTVAETTAETTPQSREAPQPQKKPWRKKIWLRGLMIAGWFLAVCLVTALIYNAVNREPKPTGALLHVTIAPTPSLNPAGTILSPMAPHPDESRFPQPVTYSDLDLIANTQTTSAPNITIVYDSGEVCYIPETYSHHEKSLDRQKVAVLTTSGNLWKIDSYGTKRIWEDVSRFALSGDGTCLYFISGNQLYYADTEADSVQLLAYLEKNTNTLAVSHAGTYCAFSYTDNSVIVIEKGTGNRANVKEKLSSLAAISEDGRWVYGYSPEDGFLRVNTKASSLTLSLSAPGDMIPKLYFNKDATMLYYEYQDTLYFCNEQQLRSLLLPLTGSWWQPFLERYTAVYTRENLYVQDMFFYDGSFYDTLLYANSNTYTLKAAKNQGVYLELAHENAFWMDDDWLMYGAENTFMHYNQALYSQPKTQLLPAEIINNWNLILGTSPYGILLYIDHENILHGYSIIDKKECFTADYGNISSYALSNDGKIFYYLTQDGSLNGFSIPDMQQKKLGEFPSTPGLDFEEVRLNLSDACVYLRDSRESETKIYRVSMEAPYLTYLGEEIYG